MSQETAPYPEPSISDRWYAALCYAGFLVLVPILVVRPRSTFLAAHCRQGFSLLFAEIVGGLLLWVLESTFNLVPVLGVLLNLILHLAYWLLFVAISAVGFVKALSGERFEVAGLEDLANRVPIEAQDQRRTM
ncbi:MAG TPA: hypothetical protein PLL30_07150 [Candidatus Krumholzibacteria bacterium]|nr:hypothetical protein [Candidatus Krumholzibacteria bacterium]HPD71534.1 hypothetical protein [Candidatus Krumholzibacteria bacterium]HRY41533.1 hypothetical protein [Candidatus Krumholzibacteria bacterium]